jgi:mannose-6-phosphate isomerase-like protein (cupin superfamily)
VSGAAEFSTGGETAVIRGAGVFTIPAGSAASIHNRSVEPLEMIVVEC